ncbi:MAG TPA: hypothetical protein VJ716_07200 [Gaiellaceae bacterium]|nr:hypothetical protein [Gaiellaceae bacterium]
MANAPLQNVVASTDAGSDLTADFRALLTKLTLLGNDPKALDESEVIQATSTALTKVWGALTGVAGGGLTLASIIAAWKASDEQTKLACIGVASLILSATVIAIALIVRSDLAARAGVTSSLYRARTAITDAVVAASGVQAAPRAADAAEAAASTAFTDTLASLLASLDITVPGQDASAGFYGLRREAAGGPLEVRRSDNTWLALPAALALSDLVFELELPVPAHPPGG